MIDNYRFGQEIAILEARIAQVCDAAPRMFADDGLRAARTIQHLEARIEEIKTGIPAKAWNSPEVMPT